LSEEQYSSIRNWIPPPAIEEETLDTKEGSGAGFQDSSHEDEQTSDPESDADSDIERHLVKRYRDIALSSLEEKDYPRAESFYRKVIEMSSDSDAPTDDGQDLKIMLAFSCALQGKWDESETVFPPIAFARGVRDIRPFHGLYALSMVHFNKGDYDTATKYCKRAVGGYRRLLGKSDPQYFEAMHILALIYDSKGDPVSAEGCRTFLPAEALAPVALSPQNFLEKIMSNDPNAKEAQNRLRSTTPIPPSTGPSGNSLSQSQLGSQASASSTAVQSLSGTANSSVEAISQKLEEQRLEPRPLSSLQLDTTNMVDETSNAKLNRDMLADERKLLASHNPSTQQYAAPVPRSESSPQPRTPARLIVAVDFGTTHTSVAWAFVGAEGAREDLLTSWPGAPNHTKPAVIFPSSIHGHNLANGSYRFQLYFITITTKRWLAGVLILLTLWRLQAIPSPEFLSWNGLSCNLCLKETPTSILSISLLFLRGSPI
jgi:tetratricopeptide (TPR) repeat protein